MRNRRTWNKEKRNELSREVPSAEKHMNMIERASRIAARIALAEAAYLSHKRTDE
jgi:hypothetical protein